MSRYSIPDMKKIHKDNVENISCSIGEFSDGRPYVVELWGYDGITMVTIYMSAEDFMIGKNYVQHRAYEKYHGNSDEIIDVLSYLSGENVIDEDYSIKNFSVLAAGDIEDKMLSINIAVANEDDVYEKVRI